MRTAIKFCGLTRAQDVDAAAALGVDAVGFVMTRHSRRFVDIAQARALRERLPPFVSAVVLLMDDSAEWVEDVVAGVRPDLVQFHGDEAPEFARRFARPYLKAISMRLADPAAYAQRYADAAGVLLDSHAAGTAGGTGVAFDWTRVPRLERPVVLAGGLDAANLAQAIAVVRPYAVDVSSGIESAPGIKDAAKMRDFVAAVRAADART